MAITEENRKFVTSMLEEVPFGLIAFDNQGRIILINPKAAQFLNIQDGDQALYQELLPMLKSRRLKNRIKSLIGGQVHQFKLIALAIDNRYLTINAKKIASSNVLHILDSTEAIMMRDQATQSLLLGQESERQRISKEIHDGVGPLLSTIKINIDSLANKTNDENQRAKMQEISNMISDAASDIRQISHDLMPRALLDFGIRSTLEAMVRRINSANQLNAELSINIDDGMLQKELELNLYRIAQELVNNALKHAKAKNVYLRLHKFEQMVVLEIEDDGNGMDQSAISEGIGIHNINTRVKSFRGTLNLETEDNQGTRFIISIPLKKQR